MARQYISASASCSFVIVKRWSERTILDKVNIAAVTQQSEDTASSCKAGGSHLTQKNMGKNKTNYFGSNCSTTLFYFKCWNNWCYTALSRILLWLNWDLKKQIPEWLIFNVWLFKRSSQPSLQASLSFCTTQKDKIQKREGNSAGWEYTLLCQYHQFAQHMLWAL